MIGRWTLDTVCTDVCHHLKSKKNFINIFNIIGTSCGSSGIKNSASLKFHQNLFSGL